VKPKSTDLFGPLDEVNGELRDRLTRSVIAARLDLSGRSRAWWAEELSISPSAVSHALSGGPIATLEMAYTQHTSRGSSTTRTQDLPARLPIASPGRDVFLPSLLPLADFCGLFVGLNGAPLQPRTPAEALVRAMTVVGSLRGGGKQKGQGISIPRIVEDLVAYLALCATGPYGVATEAHELLVQLASLLPAPVALELKRTFSHPMGFRLLRTYASIVDRLASGAERRVDQFAIDHIGNAIRETLMSDGFSDIYPGREWTVAALGRLLVYSSDQSRWADQMLRAVCADPTLSFRQRAQAWWILRRHGIEDVKFLGDGPADNLLRAVSRHVTSATEYESLITEKSSDYQAMNSKLLQSFVNLPKHLTETVCSIVLAAVFTPDAQLRRMMIESIVAADLARIVTESLGEVVLSVSVSVDALESIVFLMCRLRDSSAIATFCALTTHSDSNVSYAAQWGLGDVFRYPSADAIDGAIASLEGSGSLGSLSSAACHALCVMPIPNRFANQSTKRMDLMRANIAHPVARWYLKLCDSDGSLIFPDVSTLRSE
jgi:hypothetical protein